MRYKVRLLNHEKQWWKIVRETFHDHGDVMCVDCEFRVRDFTRLSYGPVLVWGINMLCPPREAKRCLK